VRPSCIRSLAAFPHDLSAVVTAVLIADPTPIRIALTVLVLLAVVLALLVRHFATRVERGCPECDHCTLAYQRRMEDERRQRLDEARRNLRWLGVSDDEIERHLRDVEKRH
jgi:hypothetical protein